MKPSITLQRHKEHYEIADSFGGRAFSRSEFKQRYQAAYPTRAPGSMIPSDFCVDLHAKGAETFPKFLRQPRRGWYQML